MRLLGFRTPIPEGYFRMLTASSLQAPVLDAPVYDAPDTVVLDWSDPSTIEDGVHVYASYSEIDVNALPPPAATLAPNTVQYGYTFDAGEPLEERLYFRVAAFKSGIVKVSNEQSIGNPANVLYPDSPTWLFGDGEYGYANTLGLDTLYTDTAGTTPVEEYGDTIALATNLASNGPDMVQSTSGERPIYGRMPKTGEYPQVRNLLPSNMMAGAASPSTLPSGWGMSSSGLSYSVSDAIVDDDGAPYVALRLYGTPSSVIALVYLATASAVPSAKGDARTTSIEVALSDGDATNISSIVIRNYEYNDSGSSVANDGSGSTFDIKDLLTESFQRFARSRTMTNDATAFIRPALAFGLTAGQDVDITLLLKLPQVEAGLSVTGIQRIVTQADVTEPGIASTDIAYLDSADDAFVWTFDAGTYYLFVAGEKGCVFADVEHEGGNLEIGPTTWPDGPADGLAEHVGQRHVIMPVIRSIPFSSSEKTRLIAYANARGTPEQPDEINIFLVGGQSNVDGRYPTSLPGTPSYLADNMVDGVSVWDGSAIVPYSLSVTGPSGNGTAWVSGTSSNRFSFAHVALKLVADEVPNVVACWVSNGGAILNASSNSSGCWSADYDAIPEGTVSLLQALLNRYADLRAYCDMRGIRVNLRGLIWHQGEADDDPIPGAAYADNWPAFVAKLRAETGAPNLPIYYGTIPSDSGMYNADVRAAQLGFAALDSHAYCRDNNGLTFMMDGVHFDGASSTLFGEDVATAILGNW